MGPFDLLYPLPPDRRGREPEHNAWVELHNVIVAADDLDELAPDHVDRIRRQRGVDLAERYYPERVDLYQRYLDWTLRNDDLSDDDRQLLAALARTLYLGTPDLVDSHRRAFGNVVHDALADDCLSVDERLLLYKLQHTLGLDPGLAEGAYEVMARERLLVTVARVLCDGQLSPEEAEEVERTQRDLGVSMTEGVATMLEQAATRWRVHRGDLPDVDAGMPLPEGERGHFVETARWRSVNLPRLKALFSDPDSREALREGDTYHYRMPPVVLSGTLKSGQVVLTNRRLLLISAGLMPRAMSLASLRRVRRFSNGVLLNIKGERAVCIESGDDRTFVETLTRVMTPDASRKWTARWRPLYAAERDVAFASVRRRSSEPEAYTLALGTLRRMDGWSAEGHVRINTKTLTLRDKNDRKRVSLRTILGAYSLQRKVWLARQGSHDWLLEFPTEDQAQRFVRALERTG